MRRWSIWQWMGLMTAGFVLTVASFLIAGGSDRHEPRYSTEIDRALCEALARQEYRSQDQAPAEGRPTEGRQPENCEPPSLLHYYLAGVAGTVISGAGLFGIVARGFQTGGLGRTPRGQVSFGIGAVALVMLMMLPVLEEAERAVCLIMCPPARDDAFTAIFLGYFFLSLLLLPVGLLLVAVGVIRKIADWNR